MYGSHAKIPSFKPILSSLVSTFSLFIALAISIVHAIEHILATNAGKSAPKYLAINTWGIANVIPDTNVIPTTPFKAFILFSVSITSKNGIKTINPANWIDVT